MNVILVSTDEKYKYKIASLLEGMNATVYKMNTLDDVNAVMTENCVECIDLIITEKSNDGNDTFEFCKELKQGKICYMVPIIVISDENEDDDIIKSFESGADDMFFKSSDMKKLKKKIKNIMYEYGIEE